MDKKTIILLIGVLPAMKTAATFLRFKDADSIGADDLIAELIERNAKIVETYILTGQIPQEFRNSLPADLAAKL